MARKGNGSSSYLRNGDTLAFGGNFAISFWYRNNSAPAVASLERVFQWDATGNDEGVGFGWNHPGSGFTQAWFIYDTDYRAVKYTTSLQANTWHRLTITRDGTTTKAYLGATEEVSTTTPGTPTGGASPILHLLTDSSVTGLTDGEIADFGFWKFSSGTLTANEVKALALGVPSYRVRPDASVARFYPLFGVHDPEIDYSGNQDSLTLTNAPSRTNHPPVTLYTPRWASTIPLIETSTPAAQRRRVGTGAGWGARR
jgi:hypothetical protein